ncbi:MAG: alpha/beta hydrolase [Deltaproteobacteria bacterium]|nr:alpha/beta hydrolase [Deltaproteobacteria bacterium]
MSDLDVIDRDRRRFLGAAATVATATLAVTRAAAAPAQRAAPAKRTGGFGAIKQIDAGLLNVGYVDEGPASGPPVILLHGWPYDIHAFVEVVPRLAAAGYRVIVPHLRGYGTTRFRARDTFRNGQQSAFGSDLIALMDALHIDKAVIAGFDWGARTANVVAALWPARCKAMVAVSGYIIVNLEANKLPLPPAAEYGWWYQYYFATERGRHGYDANRHDFAKLIWKLASPTWSFDDATFERSAAALSNPDHVDIVIHNYRWRLSLAEGERQYDALEARLAARPVITVPSITIASDFDGGAADGAAYKKLFSGRHEHRILAGVGHNVPQEAPEAFAQAIQDVLT